MNEEVQAPSFSLPRRSGGGGGWHFDGGDARGHNRVRNASPRGGAPAPGVSPPTPATAAGTGGAKHGQAHTQGRTSTTGNPNSISSDRGAVHRQRQRDLEEALRRASGQGQEGRGDSITPSSAASRDAGGGAGADVDTAALEAAVAMHQPVADGGDDERKATGGERKEGGGGKDAALAADELFRLRRYLSYALGEARRLRLGGAHLEARQVALRNALDARAKEHAALEDSAGELRAHVQFLRHVAAPVPRGHGGRGHGGDGDDAASGDEDDGPHTDATDAGTDGTLSSSGGGRRGRRFLRRSLAALRGRELQAASLRERDARARAGVLGRRLAALEGDLEAARAGARHAGIAHQREYAAGKRQRPDRAERLDQFHRLRPSPAVMSHI